MGVLVTTHYMEEAQQCDRLVLMSAGAVAAEGTVADIVVDRTVVESRRHRGPKRSQRSAMPATI